MKHILGVTAILLSTALAGTARAQDPTTGLEAGGVIGWASIGFQSDIGGSVNSSGIGTIQGFPTEINSNTWGERYDVALILRFGVGYNLSPTTQLTLATHWEQAESDRASAGLIGGVPLQIQFSDQQGWGIDFGVRRFFPTRGDLKPFYGGSLGFERTEEITVTMDASAHALELIDVPFYDDSWVINWRFGGGFLWDINERVGWQLTVDLKYSGVLSDAAGLGQLVMERINDTGNRWTLPIMAGVYVRF